MGRDRLAGDGGQAGSKVRQHRGGLTEKGISGAGGRRDMPLERVRAPHGLGPDEAGRRGQDRASGQWASGEDPPPR